MGMKEQFDIMVTTPGSCLTWGYFAALSAVGEA